MTQTHLNGIEEAVIWGGLIWPAILLLISVGGPIATTIGKTSAGLVLLNAYLFGVMLAIVALVTGTISFAVWIAYVAFAPVCAVVAQSCAEQVREMRDVGQQALAWHRARRAPPAKKDAPPKPRDE